MNELIGKEPVHMERDLRLRQFTISDANELLRLHQDPIMRRYLLDDIALDTLPIVTDFLCGLGKFYREHPGLGIWALERLETRFTREQLMDQGALDQLEEAAFESLLQPKWRLRGWFNLTPVPGQAQHIELGSRLHRDAWGQRIACAVGQQLVAYAFEVLKVESLQLHCHPLNQPALYCAAYLGFEYPEPVVFLESDALRLTATPDSSKHSNTTSDSQRRRKAVGNVRRWVEQESRVSA